MTIPKSVLASTEIVADHAAAVIAGLESEIAKVIVGQRTLIRRLLTGLFAAIPFATARREARAGCGHILLEGVPGVAKTLMATTLAHAIAARFQRIQLTPDLLPADILGTRIYDAKSATFRIEQGPIFTHILLADEINRATPKTQAALLEAMQEAQVTVEGESFRLEPPFLVVATQNPIELEGTYPLPEAQLDRFMIRVAVGYPTAEEERQILERRRERRQDEVTLDPVVSREEVVAMQQALEDVFVADVVAQYVVDLAQATRGDHRIALGASPRGALALLKLARASAVLRGRDFVTPDDVKAMAAPALAHRVILQPELWVTKLSAAQVVDDLLTQVPAPKTDEPR